MSLSSPLEVLVCGTKFGAMYMRAVASNPQFNLIGIHCKGSDRSKKLAEEYRVPLLTSLEDIPKKDHSKAAIAVVAIRSSVLGGESESVASSLMKRGYDVLIEPPIRSKELADLIKSARSSERKLAVANMYAHVPHIAAFLKAFSDVAKKRRPFLIEVGTSFHTVAFLSKILDAMMPGSALRINKVSTEGPFRRISAQLANTALSMLIHNEVDDAAPDAYVHATMRFSAHFPEGTLHLVEACGPLLWLPAMKTVGYSKVGLPLSNETTHPIECLMEEDRRNSSIWISDGWTCAISENILNFASATKNLNASDVLCSRNWSTITKAIGYPSSVHVAYEEEGLTDSLKRALGE